MKDFDPEDPIWTAYILNELSEEQAEALEQEFIRNPELKAYADELYEAANLLNESFESEPALKMEDPQRADILLNLPNQRKKYRPYSTLMMSYAIAAVLVIFLSIGFILTTLSPSLSLDEGSAGIRIMSDEEIPPALRASEIVEVEELFEAPQYIEHDISPEIDGNEVFVGTTMMGRMASGGRKDPPEAAQMPGGIISPSQDDFAPIEGNPFRSVSDHPLSTFSIDVDTASYSVVRQFLNRGTLPPPDAVRIEEMINYFDYEYEAPTDGNAFAAHMEVAACPWAPEHHLVRIALKGREIPKTERPPLNLVYLLDVSGSMSDLNKLPLVKKAMALLAEQLDERDRVAIVVYAGAAGVVLPPTSGEDTRTILASLDRLKAGGSTAGGAGIQLAYKTAREHFEKDGVNRVILCTDGDFNVGLSQRGDLEHLIEKEATSGIQLSIMGFGMGNYKDANLEGLSNKGNGNYGYIDTFQEARKLFVEEMLGTLVTIAKDVKIQVEFNPAMVAGYRLIGYENRMLKKEDFNNDKVDAGDIGAGHTVTALYEIVPAGQEVPGNTPAVDPLKYQTEPRRATTAEGEWLTLKLRHKQPGGDHSTKQEFPLPVGRVPKASEDSDFRFATAVAAYGFWLREPEFREQMPLKQIVNLAKGARGEDELGYRAEFIRLMQSVPAQP